MFNSVIIFLIFMTGFNVGGVVYSLIYKKSPKAPWYATLGTMLVIMMLLFIEALYKILII